MAGVRALAHDLRRRFEDLEFARRPFAREVARTFRIWNGLEEGAWIRDPLALPLIRARA